MTRRMFKGTAAMMTIMFLCITIGTETGNAADKISNKRFIANGDGTVTDTNTGLMWAAKDNGKDISWANAKSYCENYRGGGYTDWRLPTQHELMGLFDANKSQKAECGIPTIHIATDLIHLTCWWVWGSETRGSDAAGFHFGKGPRALMPQSHASDGRALPVRSGK